MVLPVKLIMAKVKQSTTQQKLGQTETTPSWTTLRGPNSVHSSLGANPIELSVMYLQVNITGIALNKHHRIKINVTC